MPNSLRIKIYIYIVYNGRTYGKLANKKSYMANVLPTKVRRISVRSRIRRHTAFVGHFLCLPYRTKSMNVLTVKWRVVTGRNLAKKFCFWSINNVTPPAGSTDRNIQCSCKTGWGCRWRRRKFANSEYLRVWMIYFECYIYCKIWCISRVHMSPANVRISNRFFCFLFVCFLNNKSLNGTKWRDFK